MERLRQLKRSFVVLVCVALPLALAGSSLASSSGAAAARATAAVTPPQYQAATVLVKFANPSKAASIVASLHDTYLGQIDGGITVVGLQTGETVLGKASQYDKRGDTVFAEPNYLAHATAVPNDTDWSDQWALTQIHAAAGWDIYPGAFPGLTAPKIAILDTGIDSTHPDLAANVGTGANCQTGTCTAGPTQDDDVPATQPGPNDQLTHFGHGTHVAGIAGAVTNNGQGIAGLAFSSQLLPVKVLDANESGTFAGVAAGIDWAVANGAKVVNLSLGGTANSPPSTLCGAVTRALRAGVLVVAAAGNSSGGLVNTAPAFYPAACPGAIGVASTTETDGAAGFSNFGFPDAFVSAPGMNILSTVPANVSPDGTRYLKEAGTSTSAPFVSALGALLLGEYPGRTVGDVKRVLAQTSFKSTVGGATYGSDPFHTCSACTWNKWFGYGRVDVLSALIGPKPSITSFTPTSGVAGTLVTISGQDLTTASDVRFGSKATTDVTVVDSSHLRTHVPNGATNGKLGVDAPGGSAQSAGLFFVVPTVTPNAAAPQSHVTLSGPKVDTATAVKFNGKPATTFTPVDDHTLDVVVPDATTGRVSVTTPDATYTTTANFTVQPKITGFSQASATTGQQVTINGFAFGGTRAVKVNGVSTGFSVTSPDTIKITVPTTATTGLVHVDTAGGSADSPAALKITPKLTSFSPASGPVGTAVTVNGSGFHGNVHVSFNGVDTVVAATSPTQLHATVPAGATTGKLTVDNGDGGPATSVGTLKVTPKITSFSAGGKVGTTVDVNGTNLNDPGATFKLGTLPLTVTPDSSTHVSFTIPDCTSGPTGLTGCAATNRLTVTTASGSYTTPTTVKVSPFVAAFDPVQGTVGTLVTLTGTSLRGVNSVKFDGVATGFSVVDDHTLKATVPTAAGIGTIALGTSVSGTFTTTDSFDVLPKILSVSPSSGPTGQQVTISGSGLADVTDVDFSGTDAGPPVSATFNQVKTVVPAGATSGPVTVTTSTGDSDTSLNSFVVRLSLTAVSPMSGAPGSSVVISGVGFTSSSVVKFNGVTAARTVDAADQITATVPSTATTGPITVTTAGMTATISDPFQVSPTISSFSPSSGVVGQTVTITGLNLTNVSEVDFGGTPATPNGPGNGTSLTVNVPTDAQSGPLTLVNDVDVTTSASDFHVLPAISSISPTSAAEGDSVVITGSSLGLVTSVDFAGAPNADYSMDSDTQLTATVPVGATAGAITIHTDAGDNVSSSQSFTPVAGVSSFDPTIGNAGTVVTISGSHFTGATAVKFNGVSATTFSVVDDHTISATVPAAATSGAVTVVAPSKTVVTGDTFTVLPELDTLSPSSGSAGDTIHLVGSGFTGVSEVQFAGVDAASFTTVSSTQIDAVVPDAAGSGPVTVFADQGVVTSPGDFTVNARIDSINPAHGQAGSTVTISGHNFGAVLDVQFNGVSTVFGLDATGTQITATVPDSATTGPITVVTFGSGSPSSSPFTVDPAIDGFDPLSGAVGSQVTISGTGLAGVTGVKFNGVDAPFTNGGANAVTATVPAGATDGPITVLAGAATPAVSPSSFTVTP